MKKKALFFFLSAKCGLNVYANLTAYQIRKIKNKKKTCHL